jgi:transcriptional regulator of acetoin/glycerol metabolism
MPVVKSVERVVEKIVIRQHTQCLQNLEQARQLIAEASDRLTQPSADSALPFVSWLDVKSEDFPTMVEVERAIILAAYHRSNRRPVEAARLLGIGKTTLYRKLKEIKSAVA